MANLRVDKITSTETFEKTGSVQFDGSVGQLTVSGSNSATTYDFGTDDFTIEFWRYKSSSAVESYVSRLDAAGGSATSDFWFGNVNGVDGFYYYEGSTGRNISTESQPLNTWAHLAVVRNNDYLRLYLNGKEVVSKPHSAAFNNGSANLRIGGDDASSGNTRYPLEGFLSNVRITKKALYTSNFKPPMRELEVTAETVLLACQSKTDASLEKTGKTLVVGGTPVANELTPGLLTPVVKSGGGSAITGSVEFDGTNDYLSIADSDDFSFGSGDFTIEGFIYPTGIPQGTYAALVTPGYSLQLYFMNTNSLSLYMSNNGAGYNMIQTANATGTDSIFQNEWSHFAFTRSGNTFRYFINGIEKYTNAVAGAIHNDLTPLGIGDYSTTPGTYEFKGYMSNIRINKGTALYTADFIPPTRELKKVPGTVLLCCQDENSVTTEVTGKTITSNGDPAASNFTPQVGDDRQITFEGVTKIDTDAYFYLPTGNTESRDKGAGTRGISFAGSDASNKINTISHINISTTGNAKDFGDLLDKITELASAASSTRGISAGGVGTSPTANEIDTVNYITMASTGDALDFGDLTLARRLLVGCSSQTRGIFAGGYDAPNKYNTMDYITIASTGDAIDFGDMVADGQTASGRYGSAGYASPTRGVWHGGYGYPAYRNIIDYATIASKGNTKDFGDSSISNYYMGGCSNSIRGISGGAYNPSPAHLNLIEYTTIATTGNAKDFGDLVQKATSTGACASQIRGVFLGGIVGGSKNNSISYVTIMTMGNALDFGDLTSVTAYNAGCSNGHGGLG